MARTGRPGSSHEQRAVLWRRWKAGKTLGGIGRALDKHAASAFGAVSATGGFAPVPRRREPGSPGLADREEISRGLVEGHPFGQLGRHLGRAVSTISREVARNGGPRVYPANRADERALDNARRSKPCLLVFNPPLYEMVAGMLSDQRSPQPIAATDCRVVDALHPGAFSMNVSHETIHRSLFIQARGVLRKEILARLRSRRIMRRGRPSTTAGQTWGATSRRLLRIRLPVDRKVICGAMPETATSRRRPNAARALSCWSRSTARLTTALSAPREVGIRDAHHPNAFSVAGQKPAVRRKHPKPGVIQLCRTKGDIAAFYRRFATISSVAKESRVHHGSVRTWIKAVDLCLYSPNGELFLRDEIVVALR